MRKFLTGLVAFFFLAGAGLTISGAPITLLTNTSGCQEASQLLSCLNNLITTLNGGGNSLVSIGRFGVSSGGAINGTSPIPGSCSGGGTATLPGTCVSSLGPGTSAGSGSGFTPVVLNAQRGIASFSTPLDPASASSTLMVVNSFITTQSVCSAEVSSNGATNSTAIPFVASYTPVTGIINFALANLRPYAGAPTQTYSIAFNCM